jgi:hypothetical protein
MKYSVAFMGLALLGLAKEIPKDLERAKLYDSGEVMERTMQEKEAQWSQLEEMGLMNAAAGPQYPELHFGRASYNSCYYHTY